MEKSKKKVKDVKAVERREKSATGGAVVRRNNATTIQIWSSLAVNIYNWIMYSTGTLFQIPVPVCFYCLPICTGITGTVISVYLLL